MHQSRGGVPAGAALFHLVFQGPRLLLSRWLAIFQHKAPKVTLKVVIFFFFKDSQPENKDIELTEPGLELAPITSAPILLARA